MKISAVDRPGGHALGRRRSCYDSHASCFMATARDIPVGFPSPLRSGDTYHHARREETGHADSSRSMTHVTKLRLMSSRPPLACVWVSRMSDSSGSTPPTTPTPAPESGGDLHQLIMVGLTIQISIRPLADGGAVKWAPCTVTQHGGSHRFL